MPRRLSLSNQTSITIEDTAFAGGGEGNIHRIVLPVARQGQVVKIYKPNKRNAEREQKIRHLVDHPPLLPSSSALQNPIIWASELVYENGHFVGFVMPSAGGISLEMLCQAKLPATLGKDWQRLSFQHTESMLLRLKLCYNVAVAVSYLHRFGEYALIDLKPENILVQPNGTIALIDTDSLAIFNDNALQFAAPVVTPDFAPPEYYGGTNPAQSTVAECWDRYSMAIIFYRLLCGIHPFTGTCRPPFEHLNDISGKVERGLFVHGKYKAQYSVLPPPHSRFEQLPRDIQILLLQCFELGHDKPHQRPSPDDWQAAVLAHIAQLPKHLLLPSQSEKLPMPAVSLPIHLSLTQLLPSNIPLLHLSLRTIFASNKHSLALKIIDQEQKIQQQLQQLEMFQAQQQQVLQQFEQLQTKRLQLEKKYLKQAVGLFRQKMLYANHQAIQLYQSGMSTLRQSETEVQRKIAELERPLQQFMQAYLLPAEAPYRLAMLPIARQLQAISDVEQREIAALNHEWQPKIAKIRQQRNNLEARQIKKIEIAYKKNLSTINAQRRALEKKEQQEKNNSIKTWKNDYVLQQLAHYRIADYAHSIFTDQNARPRDIAALLVRYGIVTAADFEISNFNTGIKIINTGKIVKPTGIGSLRTASLYKWRQRIKDTLSAQLSPALSQQSLTDQITQQYAPYYQQLNTLENNIIAEIAQQKSVILKEESAQKNKMIKKEENLSQQLQQKIAILHLYFDRQSQPLRQQLSMIDQQRIAATAHLQVILAEGQATCSKEQESLKKQLEVKKMHIAQQYNAQLTAIIDYEKLYLQQQISTAKAATTQTLQKHWQSCQSQLQQIAQAALPIQQQLQQAKQQLQTWQQTWNRFH